MKFSIAEYADMIFFYGKANGKPTEARRMYTEAYPRRRIPDARVFPATFARLRETITINKSMQDSVAGFDRNIERSVMEYLEEDPTTSVRKIS